MGKTYRKTISLLLFLALFLLMIPASAFAATSNIATVDLKAGTSTIGTVKVDSVDSSTIKVTYTIDASKAWTSTNKNGLVFKEIDFKANTNPVNTFTFKTSDAASSADLTTSNSFNVTVTNLKSFTASAVVANVIGPNPITNTLTLVSSTNDQIKNGSNAVQANEPGSCWSGTTVGSHSLINTLKGAGAIWIWKTQSVSAPVLGEISDFTRSIDIPAGATNISGTFQAVCDNAYIAQVNGANTFSYGYTAPSGKTLDACFGTLDPGTLTKPNFTKNVVDSVAWQTADGSHAVSNLKAGSNTLEVKAMNEYMGSLDNQTPDGTATSNPAGLLYRMVVTYTTSFTAGTPYTASAQWTTYQVFYNGNGSDKGTVPSDSGAYATGATVQVKDPGTMSRTGFAFTGWTVNQNGSGTVYNANSVNNTFSMGTANVTLYAQWTPIPTYTVTYDGNGSNGGSVPSDGSAYITGATVQVKDPGTMSRTGFTFAGWTVNRNGSGTVYQTNSTFPMGTANVKLYAQWTPVLTYTVTFDCNGGSLPGPTQQTVLSGDPATEPPLSDDPKPPTGEMGFGGWCLDLRNPVSYDFSTAVTHDTTLYAFWTNSNMGGESFPIFSALPSFFEMFGD